MSEWKEVQLGSLVEIRHGWPFKSEYFSIEDLNRPIVVAIGNFRYTGGFRFESTDVKTYTGEYPKEYELHPGDVLLVMTCQTAGGEILGIPARVPNDERIYLHNQRLGLVHPKSTDVDVSFLYWLFLSRSFNQHLVSSASGTKILHTAPSRIESFKFHLPPLPQQRAIAHILGSLDDKIELNRKLNKTLEAMARALFQSWFVDFDPVRAKALGLQPSGMDADTQKLFPDGFEMSELGEIPRGWRVTSLDSIADFRNGLALQRFRPNEGEPRLPVVKIAQLRTGEADCGEWSRADIDPSCILKDGDIVFSWSGSLTVVVWCGGRAALNQHLFRVTSTRFPKWFYLNWLLLHLPEFQRIAGDKATTMGHIQRHHLSGAMCVVPPEQLLRRLSIHFESLLEQRILLDLQSRSLARIRDALLPRLLSGEIPIKNAERFIASQG